MYDSRNLDRLGSRMRIILLTFMAAWGYILITKLRRVEIIRMTKIRISIMHNSKWKNQNALVLKVEQGMGCVIENNTKAKRISELKKEDYWSRNGLNGVEFFQACKLL